MPTPMTHALVGASLSTALPEKLRGLPAAAGCAFLSAAPDLDIVGFVLGVPYSNAFGHRGITHGLPFAVVAAAGVVLLATVLRELTRARSLRVFLVLVAVIGSHGILDMATNGGLGVGLLIPFSPDRFFWPYRPIEVSPISPSRFLTDGLPVILTELVWVWLPSLALVIAVGSCTGRRAGFDTERG